MERVEENLEDRELISLVRGNPMIWDKTFPLGQRDRSVLDVLWAQIGAALPNERTGDYTRTRWKSIRDQFTRELRKVRSGEARSGAGASEGTAYRWPLFPELMFLKDSIKPRKTTSSFCKPLPVEASSASRHTELRVSSSSSMESATGCAPSDVWSTPLCESDDVEIESSVDDPECPRSGSVMSKRRVAVPPPDSSYSSKRKAFSKVEEKIESCASALSDVCESLSKSLAKSTSEVNVRSDSSPSHAYSLLLLDGLKEVPKPKLMMCVAEMLDVMSKYIPQD